MLIKKNTIKKQTEEPKLVYRATLDNLDIAAEAFEFSPKRNVEIPWDCLSDIRRKVVYGYIYEKKDFQTLAVQLNLNNAARVKSEFYYALTALSEYGTIRLFLEESFKELTEKQTKVLKAYYLDNLQLVEIAKSLGTTKQSVQQTIKRVISKYNIKWQVFVKKKGKQIIYNVPEIFK